ncbi:unnamed protein product [Arctia plantaginis]|uniref:G-protein coupled receptors family 1 profile domain-containing protein n=1 Tax=Arctia plantaginis TaxID=874455 RepID=A0A8S1B595_ARCPL|nr:unnamed protein product [Arctia plantaginis]
MTPRYLLTSLALNDLFTGILIAPVALLPALYKCWPYGEIFCQIQALLRGAVSQQSAIILVCMAIDRYLYLLHPATYHKHSSKKGCVLVISVTWILSVSLFAIMVLPRSGYYFNSTGLMACDVFHSRVAFRILSCCAYYFPTTMALMYCYGSGFHVSKTRSKYDPEPIRPNGVPVSCPKTSHGEHEVVIQAPVRPHSVSTSRTMAAMSLGFIVMVTPATIQEVVAACTGCKVCCRRSKSFPSYEKPTTGCCGSPVTSDGLQSKGEFEGLGEKYWGEILERTVSSSSLHAIQKACHRDPLRCSGSFKGCSSNCKQDPRYLEGYGPTDYRHLDRSAFQIESCSRQCRLKNSDMCLFRPSTSLDCGRSRSNLSLDEGHFNKSCNDSPRIDDDMHHLEHNLDRIRSLSHERSFNAYGLKENSNLLEVEVNDIVEDESDENKDYGNECASDFLDEKGEYSAQKFSRTSSLSNRELDVIKESSRSSSDTEVTLTR